MSPVLNTLLAILIVSLISLIGVFTLSLALPRLKKIILFLVSFAAGALLGDVFFHLLPEIAASGFDFYTSLALTLGVLLFFILEKFLHWHHCHEPECADHPHPLAIINLVGDGFHNFLDGLIIAGSFFVSFPLGLATTIAVALHEIPQEIGDFGILVYSGLSRLRALLFNFLSALFAFLGAGLLFIIPHAETFSTIFILPLTAGGFLYIALADLVPELHKERRLNRSALQFISLLLGLGIIASLLFLE